MSMALANSQTLHFLPIIVAVVGLWFVVSFFFHTKMIRMIAGSHPVTRQEEPELYNLLENLCISQGIPMPRLEIIETHGRNAFASGIDTKSYTVTVTRGLLQSLTKDEVEAVLAHELSHIMHHDVRLLIITIIFTGMLGFALEASFNAMRFGFRGSNRKSAGIIVVILVVLAIGYFLTTITRFMLSRSREYMADAGAVQMTKNPEALMRALQRISGIDRIPVASSNIEMMCIENSRKFMGLFATHPPITKRIEMLSELTNTPIPDIPPKKRASRSECFTKPLEGRDNWLTRSRRHNKHK